MSSHKAAALPSAWGHSHVAHVQQLIQRQFLDWARMRRQGLRWYFWDALGVLFSELRYRGYAVVIVLALRNHQTLPGDQLTVDSVYANVMTVGATVRVFQNQTRSTI